MKRPTNFMAYFQTFYYYVHVHKVLSSEKNFLKNGGFFKMLTILYSYAQLWATFATKFMKRPTIFFLYFETFHFVFTTLQNFMISKLIKRKCCPLEYVNKILLIPVTLNNVFDNNCKTYFKVCNVFFKFVSIFTLSRSFVMTTFLQQKLQLFQCC